MPMPRAVSLHSLHLLTILRCQTNSKSRQRLCSSFAKTVQLVCSIACQQICRRLSHCPATTLLVVADAAVSSTGSQQPEKAPQSPSAASVAPRSANAESQGADGQGIQPPAETPSAEPANTRVRFLSSLADACTAASLKHLPTSKRQGNCLMRRHNADK